MVELQLCCWLVSVMFFQTVMGEIVNVEIGSPGIVGTSNNLDLSYIGPAIEEAITDCNRMYFGVLNVSITYLTVDGREVENNPTQAYTSSSSYASIADRMSVYLPQWYYTKRRKSDSVAVIITGGGQDSSMLHQLSAEWNILYLTTVAYRMSSYTLSGPSPLVTGVISVETLAVTVLNLLELYNWTTVFRVVDEDSPVVYSSISNDLDVNLINRQSRILQYKRSMHSKGPNTLPALLREFRNISRVMLFLGRAEPVRSLMLTAASLNLTNGEFVYICVEPYRYLKQYGNYTWQYGDGYDQMAREAFRSLLTVHPIGQEETKTVAQLKRASDFGEYVRARAKELYQISYRPSDQPLWDVLSTYSSIKMYCQVINNSLHTDGLDFLRDGRRLTQKFLNLTFQDEYSVIFMDSNGIRRTTLAVSHFSDVLQNGRQAFLIQPPYNLRLHDLPGSSLKKTWHGRSTWPPPNEPLCGYRNDNLLCQTTFEITRQPAFIGLLSAAIFGIFCFAVFVRWHCYNSYLYEPWWRLSPECFKVRKFSTQISCESKALYPSSFTNKPLKSAWITWKPF